MSDAASVIICEMCGRPDAIKVADRSICLECYEKAGSCCMEFGQDDLWQLREEQTAGEKPGKSHPASRR